MAAYCLVDDLVTCGLSACTPGSATGPTLGNDYGRPLPFLHQYANLVLCDAMLAQDVPLPICPCVCNNSSVLPKLLNMVTQKQLTDSTPCLSMLKTSVKFDWGYP